MTDRLRQLHGSVFVRLVAIMVGMAVCLMVLVSALWLYLAPSAHDTIDRDRFHIGILVLLLVVIVAVSFIVHGFLRKLLSPLRVLSDGV
ncbi:MAG: hypothetical protein ABI625_19780, partial [bacterium]